MDVLEHEDRRLLACGRLDERPDRVEERVAVGRFGSRVDPHDRAEMAGDRDGIALGPGEQRCRARVQLLGHDRRRVALEPVAELQHLTSECSVRAALSIGERPAGDDARTGIGGAAGEFGCERRLPDTRRSEDRHEVRQALRRGTLPERLQDRQLAPPADDPRARQRPQARLGGRANGDPGADRLLLPLRNDRRGRLVFDHVLRRTVGRVAHDDPVQRCGRLEARRRVHHVACDHRLAERGPCSERDDRLAGVDGNPDLQIAARELTGAVTDDQRCAHRALCVVAVSQRSAEDTHHGIADELLDDAAERLDLAPNALVVRREHRTDLFGVELLRPAP